MSQHLTMEMKKWNVLMKMTNRIYIIDDFTVRLESKTRGVKFGNGHVA